MGKSISADQVATPQPLTEETTRALEAQLKADEQALRDAQQKLMPRATGPALINLEMAKLGDLRAAELLLEQTREFARQMPARIAQNKATLSEMRASLYEQEAESSAPELERLRVQEATLKAALDEAQRAWQQAHDQREGIEDRFNSLRNQAIRERSNKQSHEVAYIDAMAAIGR